MVEGAVHCRIAEVFKLAAGRSKVARGRDTYSAAVVADVANVVATSAARSVKKSLLILSLRRAGFVPEAMGDCSVVALPLP